MRSLTIIFLFSLLTIAGFPQKPKPTPVKPKPSITPTKKPDESTAWEKASTAEKAEDRIAELQSFIKTFPKSAKRIDALSLIATTRGQMGNDKIAAGDIAGAAVLFKAAAADAPKPVPDALFNDMLSKFPANLYFRGARNEAVDIAKIIEERSDTNASQLLNIATFYMSVENGTEAKHVAEKAIVLEPNSGAAYQTLGLAERIDFQLDESAAAYAKALELEPDSLSARRGLAEMKRSLGKSDDAVELYKEILAKESDNVPAQTGLVLSLFDAGKRADAETEMAKSLEANPGNVILLAGAAYWYAVTNDGDKAVENAQKAIAADPRFIWSHIALARGLLLQKKAADAEKALIGARQYGNFPTLEYEIASARLAAGYYREAAEELAKNFAVKDGSIQTKLGGRVVRESKNFTELVGFERRASIFAPTAADDPESAARLTALLELKQDLDAVEPNADAAAKAADQFISGDDKMKVHRQLYAATQLLDKRIALQKVLELAKAATANVDAGLDIPSPSIAVMASELYESRMLAANKGEYIIVPDVPKFTLSSILRGRVEDLNGWAQYQLDNPTESVLRLKRAVGVLPLDSAWWKTSMWRLGAALALAGNDADALDAYIKSYKSSGPDPIRYSVIAALYKKVNGSEEGLEAKIGQNPAPPPAAEAVAQKAEPTPTPEVKVEPSPVATPAATPESSPIPETPKTMEDKPKELFPPVVITVPSSDKRPDASAEIKPCVLTASEETLNLSVSGGDLAVIIGVEGDGDLEGLTATSSSPDDVSVKRETISGIKTRAIFVVSSTRSKTGEYQVKFELPCGRKEITVRVH